MELFKQPSIQGISAHHGSKPVKQCEVTKILEKFHKDHPEYALLDAFNGINLNETVGYTRNGEPLNAVEHFWNNFQGNNKASAKSKQICEVKRILDKFNKKHPGYAALDPFNGMSATRIVSYTPKGEPMNAIEDFWFKSQGNAKTSIKDNEKPDEKDSKAAAPKKVCEVKMVLDKFNRDYPELAKYQWSSTNQVVGYDKSGTPLNAIEHFWLCSQGGSAPTQNQIEDAESSESELDDSGIENFDEVSSSEDFLASD